MGQIELYTVHRGCRIHQLHLCREKDLFTNEFPEYDMKPSDGEAPVLELWRIWSTSSLALLPGTPWLSVVVPVRAPSMSQIKLSKDNVTSKSFTTDFIYIYHHHHHVVVVAQISLTLSRHSSLSFIALGRSSGQHPLSSHSCWMYVRAGRPAFARPCVGGWRRS